ncbi:hypothetical protein [Streptomyces flavotricini]|uniref:hypothetical protein n=1 Tax=Streptomyces flavotricini TaxID=66888 RepID=UPI001E3AF552|nr:hypothetical protein [Streptomyces flavotricini]
MTNSADPWPETCAQVCRSRPVRDGVTPPSAEARAASDGDAVGSAGLSPTVRETVEAIVRAVGAGDDVLIGRLLNRFTQVADFDALVHLRTRLYTALRATTGTRPNGTIPAAPGGRSSLRGSSRVRVFG